MNARWIVLKFGGTSVASFERWQTIAREVAARARERRVLVVCSALAGTTDLLEESVAAACEGRDSESLVRIEREHADLARAAGLDPAAASLAPMRSHLEEAARLLEGVRLTGEAPPRLTARVLASGELAATRLGAVILESLGVAARWLDARELLESAARPLESDERRFLAASVTAAPAPQRLEAAAGDASVVVTQGFIARTPDGETCLLGRGGSDTSAALLAALAGAELLEIWTDVPGLFTADPREVPSARLIRSIGYREARELASMGAKVLHPACLEPAARYGIPVAIRCTPHPEMSGTRIEGEHEDHPAVTAVTCRLGSTLLSVSTVAMWDTPGFLSRLFAPFEELGISVDLIGTSEAAVSVTLDSLPGGVEGRLFRRLLARLQELGDVQVVHPCAVVSIVGRRIRATLGEIAPALTAFQERPVHLISNSAEDLNLSFVVDEDEGAPLVQRLHDLLFSSRGDDPRLGPTWERLRGAPAPPAGTAWWERRREELLRIASDGRAHYVYDVATVRERARRLRRALPAVGRFYYSMKANPHPAILEALVAEGLGVECVSIQEVEAARERLGPAVPVLFTPNFCAVGEYARAAELGAELTVDGPQICQAAPELLRGRDLAVRLDPGWGAGHHAKVRTGGPSSKFGHPAEDFDTLRAAIAGAGARITGLHAHLGSGILEPDAWLALARLLTSLAARAGDALRWIDLGGGLGMPERPGQPELDLDALQAGLAPIARALPGIELRLEPGRYLVADAGVLLAPVTQVRLKGHTTFVGVATGMNSLIRPALYGAWHPIVNLSRHPEPPDLFAQIVGPICESGDVLGRDRWLATPVAGDVLLIGQAGAYGHAMASHYNLRPPADETILV
jgi:bifunctional diaminopimelate decarboxylase / aspartate kinase